MALESIRTILCWLRQSRFLIILLSLTVANCFGQESKTTGSQKVEQLQQLLSGSRWTGQFTTIENDGQLGKATKETYEISKAEKLPEGNLWMLQARVKYGDRDVTVPLPINIEWAKNTPVITVDQLLIPGLGTFDARVLIRDGKYSGTWAHNDHGGHLFGKIEKMDERADSEE